MHGRAPSPPPPRPFVPCETEGTDKRMTKFDWKILVPG